MNLNKLTHLRLIELDNVRNIDADLFRPLKSTVEKLSIGIYPHLRNNHKKLCSIFLKSLDHLKDLEIVEQHPENRRMTVTKDMFSCLDDRRNGRKLERLVLKVKFYSFWLRSAFGNRNGMMTFYHLSV